jgi:uncharacterized protein (UPF0276 family)
MERFDLGVGLALMPGLVDELEAVRHLVDCLEVEPQTFWLETGDPAAPFRLAADEVVSLRSRFGTLLAHGVSAPVGGSRPPDPAVVRLFGETTTLLDVRLASEHLSFNTGAGPDGPMGSAFFLPPRQTLDGVDRAVESIDIVRAGLTMPFSVETPVNYLQPRHDEMDDGAFIASVSEQADCGILLDLHNVWANERNGRQPVRDFVAQLPLDRVWEVHLAGGFERRGYWLDAHSGGLHPELLAVAGEVLQMLPDVRAVVYEILPEFISQGATNLLRRDLEIVHRLVDEARGRKWRDTTRRAPHPYVAPPQTAVSLRAEVWEDALIALAVGRKTADAATAGLASELDADPGVALLRELVGAGRSGRISSSLTLTIGLLVNTIGVDGVEALFAEHASAHSPRLWGSDEGRSFAEWLVHRPGTACDVLLDAALQLDLAALDSVQMNSTQTLELAIDPLELISAVHAERSPQMQPGPRRRFVVSVG